MKRIRIFILLPLVLLLSSWGWVGHQIISSSISFSFTEEMAAFEDWVQFLTDHASDADYRKNEDPSEGPKHYIDIDGYPEFVETGRIPGTLDSCIYIHGSDFVEDMGYLPWATLNTYNCIVECLKHGEWDNARIGAADLGHYIADGFMPLHLTKNYNGQLTDNYGIHGRYESDMIGEYQSEITYNGTPVVEIEDVSAYIFDYIYNNYQYVDSVILADDIAKEASDGIYNALYLETLWEETGEFTIDLFKGASHAFANLIYNAWKDAGKPDIDNAALYISEESDYRPDNIGVTYGDVGVIYLVPENTEKDLVLIRSACLDSVNAIANFEVKISLAGLSDGNYWLYARDYLDRLSGPVIFSVSATGVHAVLTNGLTVSPNPFKQFIFIDFDLQKKEHVQLKVLDTNGRLISVLKDEELRAGFHQFTWNAEAASPGTYFIMIETGDGIVVKRVIRN